MADLPSGLIPLEVAADYVGPGIASTAATMPGGSSAVFARRGRWLVVRLLEKEMSATTDLGAIRNRVLIDYRRNLADETLSSYVDGLRERASITVRPRLKILPAIALLIVILVGGSIRNGSAHTQ